MFDELIKQIGIDEDLLKKTLDLYNYVKNTYYEYFNMEAKTLYIIQDMIWYNLELKEKQQGKISIQDKGTKYSILQSLTNEVILNKQDKHKLRQELEDILKKWDKDWDIIYVYTDIAENQNKKLNDIIVYKKGESPRKYDYYKKTTLLDVDGKNIYLNKDVLLGELDNKLGEYYLSSILYDKIQELIKLCNNEKFLFLSLN